MHKFSPNAQNLAGQVVFITGASRGIGFAIAKKLGLHGARIVIAAKTTEPHPKLPGTIYSVAKELESLGIECLPLKVDIRSEDEVREAMQKAAESFGGIDILVNNASAIQLTSIETTDIKRFDLIWSVNARGTFVCTKEALPFLQKSKRPQVLTLSPPLNLDPRWFSHHAPYTVSKYAMTLFAKGIAAEGASWGLKSNCLWPATVIATAALNLIPGIEPSRDCRSPEIVADAAYALLASEHACSGETLIDEDILRSSGVKDFSIYLMSENAKPLSDLFLPQEKNEG